MDCEEYEREVPHLSAIGSVSVAPDYHDWRVEVQSTLFRQPMSQLVNRTSFPLRFILNPTITWYLPQSP